MMYQNKFVAAIKVGGKILRESSSTVSLPFGSEYSVLLKNLNSVRAMAQVTVDGKDATDGTKLIIAPNSSVEIERYIRNGNLDKGNRFKFIERTEAVEQNRGILADDGLVRVEFWTEKVYNYPIYNTWTPVSGWLGGVYNTNALGGQHLNSLSITRGSGITCAAAGGFATQNWNDSLMKSDAGITVPGSESNQKFTQGSWFGTEYQTDVIVLQLRGNVEGKPVQKPITVATRPICVTCGKVNWATDKFCSQCGTSLRLI
jgi:hypothetical protein